MMRWIRMLAVASLFGVAVGSPASSAAAAPTLSVSPTADLTDTTLISVRLTNAFANTNVSVRQCYGTDSTDQCWTYANGPQTAATGPVTIWASRSNFYGSPLGPLVDCGVIQCFLHIEAAQPFQAPYLVRDIALQFRPTPASLRQPIAVASPTTALVDRQVVALNGLGFSPSAEFRVRECWVPATYPWLQRCQGNHVIESDASGMIATTFTVRRRFTDIDPAITCGDSATPCFIIVQRTDASGERAIVMISFGSRTFAPPTLVPLITTVPEDIGVALVPVRVDAPTDRLVSTLAINWRTLPWTAGPADFTGRESTFIVSPYLPVVYLPVRVIDDSIDEPDEIVFTHIPGAINATVGGYNGVGGVVIVDND
jgi:Neocarzinostatin family